ncbi:winged helix DNA-binding domain-containing protein [Nocardia sp. MDA0666]|uniref:winged helix DNA-binding domain-containing protein n=1 Tax=Nocardia sp. MDA0666 TaxID=2135448 RepID=UPI001E305651|nr:winged helix DNA-binding domain-containing protein [Nocardia sp. MDA0666]
MSARIGGCPDTGGAVEVTWGQVFAWRLRRGFVEGRDGGSAVAVTRRLAGVQAQVTSAAETAVAVRRGGAPGELVRALDAGELMKTWAMRGTLHAMTPDTAAAALALIASARTWEKPAWQRNFGADPGEVKALTDAVAELLDGGAVLSRAELVDELLRDRRFATMGEQLRSGWGALLKPLAWQGVLCHGPARGSSVTFTAPARAVTGWTGLPPADVAAAHLIRAYLGVYGPGTPEAFNAWLLRGVLRKTTVRQWFSELGAEITEVDVEGRRTWIRTEDADELAATDPTDTVRLLGPFDHYVLGPGTTDPVLLPPAHRTKVSRTAGWISPLVLVGGRIAGTWETVDDTLTVSMFDDERVDPELLRAEAVHLARATGRDHLDVG